MPDSFYAFHSVGACAAVQYCGFFGPSTVLLLGAYFVMCICVVIVDNKIY